VAELNLKNIPEELKRELKVRAAQEDVTLRDFILETLEAAIKPAMRKVAK